LRRFYWKHYPNRKAAKDAAKRHRFIEAKKADDAIKAAQIANRGRANITKHVRRKRVSTTGVEGLGYKYMGTTKAAVFGQIVINGKTYTKTFSIAKYANKEAARDAGKEWAAQIRREHPKLPMKKQRARKRQKIDIDE